MIYSRLPVSHLPKSYISECLAIPFDGLLRYDVLS